MKPPVVNLVVVRVSDLERSRRFYGLLGIEFVRHRHGQGPEHLSAELAGLVFELYPLGEGSNQVSSVRLGFSVSCLDTVWKAVDESKMGKVISTPQPSPWGNRMVIEDPDGCGIELLQACS